MMTAIFVAVILTATTLTIKEVNVYPNLPSALLRVPHCPEVLLPLAAESLEVYATCSSDSENTDNDFQWLSQDHQLVILSELNYLVSALRLPKDSAEPLASRLQEKKNNGRYRNKEVNVTPYVS